MRATKAFFALCLLFFVSRAYAAAFPNPVGHVNDFANILPPDVARILERGLSDYAKETSIEIAVVTIVSLGDMDVGDYAVRLGNAWGVGNKQKDNGVIFLVAPNDRKVFIATGYGVEPDLPDGVCGHILDTVVLPEFKSGDIPQGIINGATAIMHRLGTESFGQRVASRAERAKAAAEARAREDRERAEEHERMVAKVREISFFLFVIALVASPFVALFVFVSRRRKYRAACVQKQVSNKRLARECGNAFESLHGSLAEADGVLKSLKAEAPKSVWGDAEVALERAYALSRNPVDKIVGISLGSIGTVFALDQLTSEGQRLSNAKSSIERAVSDAQKVLAVRDSLADSLQSIPVLQSSIKGLSDALGKKATHEDISVDTRRDAERALREAREYAVPAKTEKANWIQIAGALQAIQSRLREAVQKANEDIDFAKRARSEGPDLFKSMPGLLQKADKAVRREDVGRAAKGQYAAANKTFEAVTSRVGANTNWVAVFAMLLQADEGARKAIQQSQSDIDEAERERQAAARRRREEEEARARRRRAANYSSVSIGGGGFRSGGGGGFGGFSGGSFGGGGAGRSW